MGEIRTIFFDIGGVLLTNGWDRHHRRRVIEEFDLDWDEFEDRHVFVAHEFEAGGITLDSYLDRTVFYRSRSFTREQFVDAILDESQELPGTRSVLEGLRASRRYLMATLNNESRELNRHRIERFRLQEIFDAFFTSSFLGKSKPDPAIFHTALDITQTAPADALFVDDRAINVEAAADVGLNVIQFESPEQLRSGLEGFGLEVSS
ncbi:MAG TPA: HAD family phosphatase [Acidimicrobiia bacterium]|nr:HAD family phosphatase [Acidimicrobiia bacterium]